MTNFDYTSVSSNLSFPVGSSDADAQCLNITIINDDALEGDQMFALSLTTLDRNAMIAGNVTAITITDSDG